jgi:hypothetical protein
MTIEIFDLDTAIAERQAVTQAHCEEAQRKLETQEVEAARQLASKIRGEIGHKMADGISLYAGHHITRNGPSSTYYPIFRVGSDRWFVRDCLGSNGYRQRFIYATGNRRREWFTPWNAGTLLDVIAELRNTPNVELDDAGEPIDGPRSKCRPDPHLEAFRTLDELR